LKRDFFRFETQLLLSILDSEEALLGAVRHGPSGSPAACSAGLQAMPFPSQTSHVAGSLFISLVMNSSRFV